MTTQLSPDRVGLPPPHKMDLIDAHRVVGWIRGDAVGFRGFADEVEAAHAAWVAYRTLARRLARTHGTRPIPIDTEPLALQRRGDQEVILASNRHIAVLVRPGAESASGPDSFGFEIRVPPPADELRVRAMAHLMYRTLRRSGLRWGMWRPAAVRVDGAALARPGVDRANDRANDSTVGESGVAAHPRRRAWRAPALPWRRSRRARSLDTRSSSTPSNGSRR
jgi:hypothetical protein